MAGLKEVRLRITSVRSTQQITSAMKMVSASKLRRAQAAIVKMRPYARKLYDLLSNLSAGLEHTENNVYSMERTPHTVLMVVISSNKGLCGAFNTNVCKKAVSLINEKYADLHASGKVHILTIGRKATDYFSKRKYPVVSSHDKLFDHLSFEETRPIVQQIMAEFAEQHYDVIELVYNRFKNAAMQDLTAERFLPVVPADLGEHSGERIHVDYILEPSRDAIIEELIPKILKIQFYKALLDSFAAEHGARMTAMHKATDNATDILRDLRLQYNKSRQTQITKEILEIVSGAEALKG